MYFKQALIVDFFNTLVELEQDTPRSWERLSAMGFPSCPELEEVWSPDGFDGATTPAGAAYDGWRRELFRAHAASAGVPERRRDAVVDALSYDDRGWTVRAAVGAKAFLEGANDAGWTVVVCTNWDYEIKPYLEQAGLPTTLACVTSRQAGARKPASRPFELALALVGADSPSACVVGDSLSCDMVGAIRTGLRGIWLRGDPNHPLASGGWITTARSLADALALATGGKCETS